MLLRSVHLELPSSLMHLAIIHVRCYPNVPVHLVLHPLEVQLVHNLALSLKSVKLEFDKGW